MAIKLSDLTNISKSFVAFADALKRPLTKTERSANIWILWAWEKPHIRRRCKHLPMGDIEDFTATIGRLRAIFYPDPITQTRLKRSFDELDDKGREKELAGVKRRGMTLAEAADRLDLLNYLAAAIQSVSKELSLCTDLPNDKIKKLSRAARCLADELKPPHVNGMNVTGRHIVADLTLEPLDI